MIQMYNMYVHYVHMIYTYNTYIQYICMKHMYTHIYMHIYIILIPLSLRVVSWPAGSSIASRLSALIRRSMFTDTDLPDNISLSGGLVGSKTGSANGLPCPRLVSGCVIRLKEHFTSEKNACCEESWSLSDSDSSGTTVELLFLGKVYIALSL